MPTQGERQNFLWRPNDNSATTLTRYSLEAEHWTKAFKSANASYNQPVSFSESFGLIGLLLGLVSSLLILIVLVISNVFKFLYAKAERANAIEREMIRIKAIDKSHALNKVKEIIAKRPSDNFENRDDLFEKAAALVVKKQEASLTFIMYELKLEFEKACKIIDELYASGIISGLKNGSHRKVLIENLMLLDLFFEVEKDYFK
jgi:DNA segregation ATPase FtsK/SpoIIIE-like protein